MRNAFAEELTKLAKKNEKIMLLSGDIGNRLFDNYKAIAPKRFINCGVAEQNMMSVAAGMAMSGLKPITYTITSFLTTRCFEQIKIDVCYHNLPVIIVGVGSGLCYANCGPTHHSCEDISILRSLPNLKIICPGDAYEVKAALKTALKHNGPVYIRLGKKNEPLIHKIEPTLIIGKALQIQEGENVCILSTGNMLPISVEVGEKLKQEEISTRVMSFHTIKPLDQELLLNAFTKFKVVVTIEEHSLIGGLGSSVSEWLVDNIIKPKAKLLRFGTPDEFPHVVMNRNYAHKFYGLTPESIIQKIKKLLLETKMEEKDENRSSNINKNW